METNPLKMKPYYLSTFTKSLKTPSCKTMPQWSFKKTISKWTSMPGCTIHAYKYYIIVHIIYLACSQCLISVNNFNLIAFTIDVILL